METTDALKEAPAFVRDLFRSRLPEHYLFHSYDRTTDVVETCEEIGREVGLKRVNLEIVLLAAWFHDTGYTVADRGHEEHSAAIAAEFLKDRDVELEAIDAVVGCIRATGEGSTPRTILEEVVCDAALAFVGRKKFQGSLRRLRMERELLAGGPLGDREWTQWCVDFLKRVAYHTPSGRSQFGSRKAQHLLNLQIEQRNLTTGDEEKQARDELKHDLTAARLEREKRPERGVETLFRTVPRTHLDLSAIADHKANILISVNALIISIMISIVFRRMDEVGWLIFPTLLLLAVCVSTLIFATLATKPVVTSGTFTKADIEQKRANLLFFGNFYRMPLDDFQWGMTQMMNDREYLYGSMVRDIYSLGQVLGRKYRYLRISYNIFMYGIIAAVLAFAGTILFSRPSP
jgi:predicted metal-dependent HD superfamily phosphohydrolase